LTPGGPVLVFGGSFDPPTLAHVTLPPLAAESIGASRLIYVPVAVSPHKTDTPPTSAKHRLAMLRLALADTDGAEIDTRELDRGGVSRTIDTLESLRAEVDASVSLRLLIGTDQARSFDRWYRWEEILRLADPVVMARGDDEVREVLADIEQTQGRPAAAEWMNRLLTLPRMDHSSTRARAATTCLRDDVPEAVAAYIESHELY
jgi:nicotinate-nucleotide adenylyltransferase